jgi:hypothetical protein
MVSGSSSPSDSRLVLGSEVYFCVTEGQGVFLDLKQDDYSAIPVPAFDVSSDESDGEAAILSAFEAHRRELLEARVLEECTDGIARFQAFRSIPRPAASIFHLDEERAFGIAGAPDSNVRVGARDVLDLFSASHRASMLLKKHHICEIVCGVRARKAKASAAGDSIDGLKRHTAIFRKLRPWYPRSYLCLFDALALLEFLARRRLFPTWVFGVQAQPFGAHCWVQAGDRLLNEGAEFANQFTPIMAV